MQKEIVNWLIKNKAFLNISGIANHMNKKYGMHPDVLIKAVNGRQSLSDKWIKPLTEIIKEIQKP